MGKEEEKVLKIDLLSANKLQPISINLMATYCLAYLGHNVRNIIFFYHVVVAEVFQSIFKSVAFA